MLVLSRKTGEKIMVSCEGITIKIAVIACIQGRARIGLDAPRNVIIDREEVYAAKLRKIQNNGLEHSKPAASSTNGDTEPSLGEYAEFLGIGDMGLEDIVHNLVMEIGGIINKSRESQLEFIAGELGDGAAREVLRTLAERA